MKLGGRYKTKNGESIRTPLKFSKCKRFIYCKVETKDKTFYRWYYNIDNLRQFEIKI